MRFSIRDVLWLTVVVALAVAWWIEHRRAAQLQILPRATDYAFPIKDNRPMFRYRLRTLLLLTILGPPMLAGAWFGWLAYRENQRPQPEVDWMTVTVPLIILEEEENKLGLGLPE